MILVIMMLGFNYCINCGFKLMPNDNFCPNCGIKIGEDVNSDNNDMWILQYKLKIDNLKMEYDSKVERASELIKKEFHGSEESQAKFISAIDYSNNVFYNQLEVTQNMLDLATHHSQKLESELDAKIKSLEEIIEKMDELIEELIIHLSDKKSEEEIKRLSEEMDDLINSVKDY